MYSDWHYILEIVSFGTFNCECSYKILGDGFFFFFLSPCSVFCLRELHIPDLLFDSDSPWCFYKEINSAKLISSPNEGKQILMLISETALN